MPSFFVKSVLKGIFKRQTLFRQCPQIVEQVKKIQDAVVF